VFLHGRLSFLWELLRYSVRAGEKEQQFCRFDEQQAA